MFTDSKFSSYQRGTLTNQQRPGTDKAQEDAVALVISNNGSSDSEQLRHRRTDGNEGTSSERRPSLLDGIRHHFSIDFRRLSSIVSSDDENSNNGKIHETHYHPNDYRRRKMKLFACFASILFAFCIAFILSIASQHSERNHIEMTDENSNDIRKSCGNFFEPNDIMSLKQSSTVENAKFGAVAADHPLCSEMGMKIMRDRGGNAVDAAIATALCLGIANPASSGIGGGAFILIHADLSSHKDKTEGDESYESPSFIDMRNDKVDHVSGEKITEVIDCRETAPAAASFDMYLQNHTDVHASTVGALAVAVPGELRGLELAHARHGLLPWEEVVKPAMELARDGVKVTKHLADDIEKHTGLKFELFRGLRYLLTQNNDLKTKLKENDIMKNPMLAKTLEAVMKSGADAVYNHDIDGGLASSLAADIQMYGGIITADDLMNYRPVLRSPLIARKVDGFTLVGVPPPSSGGAAVVGAARFLSGYSSPLSSFADTLGKHRIMEAARNAFAIRMSLSDPDYNTKTVEDAVADLVQNGYMESLRRRASDYKTMPLSQYGGVKWSQLNDDDGQGRVEDAHEGDRRRRLHRQLAREFGYLDDHGTSHLSVVDKDRNAVSITSSVNLYFGSGVVSESTGILLNNQMDDFGTPGKPNYYGLTPSVANYISGGKKPLSSMSPTIIFKDSENSQSLRQGEDINNHTADKSGIGDMKDTRKENEDNNHLGELLMVLGASGGPKIISSVLQVFLNYAMIGLPLFESVSHPRLHDQLLYHGKAVTTYELSHPAEGTATIEVTNRTKTALTKRGHRIIPVDYMGCVQAVAVDLETNHLSAVSDIRKGGRPAGY